MLRCVVLDGKIISVVRGATPNDSTDNDDGKDTTNDDINDDETRTTLYTRTPTTTKNP
jgi:hypothetical protein